MKLHTHTHPVDSDLFGGVLVEYRECHDNLGVLVGLHWGLAMLGVVQTDGGREGGSEGGREEGREGRWVSNIIAVYSHKVEIINQIRCR